ncbi:hypothetical protein RIF29_39282 [Crotalaria pallida]|uniref:Uncharacterized protein n=1 Tax=Crotalaria pallida TaxID=3830 RepID=A0AAN9E1I6_CROPI
MANDNYNVSEFLANLRESRAILESRIARQNADMRRQQLANQINPQREHISNPIVSNFKWPIQASGTRNFNNIRAFQAPPSQRAMAPRGNVNQLVASSSIQHEAHRFPSKATTAFGRNNAFGLAQFPSSSSIRQDKMEMKVSQIDGTKPYINQLDKPIINNDWFVNRDNNMYGGNPRLEILDLELRL